MPRLVLTTVALIALMVGGSRSVAAQETLAAAKELYASANYEDALKMLRGLELADPDEKLEGAQYQVFCLIALDRMPEAEKVVQVILDSDPLYAPDKDEASPRVVQMFDAVRAKAAPALAKDLFADAKAALDRKERDLAVEKFELLLKVIERAGDADNTLLSELKLLANGYVDLARAIPAAKPASPASPTGANGSGGIAPVPTNGIGAPNGNGNYANSTLDGGSTPANGSPAGSTTVLPAGFVPAVPLTERFPPYDPKFLGRGAEFKGTIKLQITADGRVASADIVQSIHQFYDRRLLDAALQWRYRPAMMKGVPVASERTVIVQLKPQEQPKP